MKELHNTKELTRLLDELRGSVISVLVRLVNREGSCFLLDRVVEKVLRANEGKLAYSILDNSTSGKIMLELQLNENPSLLLVKEGKVMAVFSGFVSQFQLESAIANLDGDLDG